MSNDDRRNVSTEEVRRLIANQFPQWSGLPIERAAESGWDNRTYRLGPDMKVRLPSASRYAAQVDKENRWLPVLAPHLPVPIPVPLAVGVPEDCYPWPWSVQRWLPGETATPDRIPDLPGFATGLADFLHALQRIPASGGPVAGSHSFHRGGALAVYDAETRTCIDTLRGAIDAPAVTAIWEDALSTTWNRPPVWVHGDFAAGNVLVADGTLSAVIDFGLCAVGDPACDLVICWTLLSGGSRSAFQDRIAAGADCWARARGWAVWKALLVMCDSTDNPVHHDAARQVLDDVVAEFEAL